jgi:hypothetical protein
LFGAPWLKDGCSLSTQSPLYAPLAHVKVQDIIEPSTKVWNATLISNLFDHNTSQLILNTSLHHLVHEDKIIWKAEKNGSYSVRSAYRICVTEIADNSHLHVPGKWSLIWKLKVPPKIRNFVWRVCRGCFPTRARLSSRGIHCPNDCVLCGTNYEDSIQVLLECPGAMQAWREVNLWDIIDRTLRRNYNMDALIFSLLD